MFVLTVAAAESAIGLALRVRPAFWPPLPDLDMCWLHCNGEAGEWVQGGMYRLYLAVYAERLLQVQGRP